MVNGRDGDGWRRREEDDDGEPERPRGDSLHKDEEGGEAHLLPRSDLLLELAIDGDARRRELGRGHCGASRERGRKRGGSR